MFRIKSMQLAFHDTNITFNPLLLTWAINYNEFLLNCFQMNSLCFWILYWICDLILFTCTQLRRLVCRLHYDDTSQLLAESNKTLLARFVNHLLNKIMTRCIKNERLSYIQCQWDKIYFFWRNAYKMLCLPVIIERSFTENIEI